MSSAVSECRPARPQSATAAIWGLAASFGAAACSPLACQTIAVQNDDLVPRQEVVRVSVAFPEGACLDLEELRLGSGEVSGFPLVRWGDGSLAVAQIHLKADVPPGSVRTYVLEPRTATLPDAALVEGRFHTLSPAMLQSEVEDPFGRTYVARFVPDLRAGPSGLAAASAHVRIYRYVDVHQGQDQTAFLGLVAYLTTFGDHRRAELTLALDNGASPHGLAPVLGPVRLRSWSLRLMDPKLRIRPRFIIENLLPDPVPGPAAAAGEGLAWMRQQLLCPSDALYLGDRTQKVFRFDLFFEDEEVTDAEREAARRAVGQPLVGWADLDEVRATGAFGGHGGPAPLQHTAGSDFSADLVRAFRTEARFGPFGSFGDAALASAQGSRRQGDSVLHNVLRWRAARLLHIAEGMVLQQGLRPTPGRNPRLVPEMVEFRRGLGPRALQRPHGFTALDYEHFGVGLLYDWYWLTGDPFARDELARIGSGLPDLWAGLPFVTSRGEGSTLEAAVLIARATGDSRLVQAAHERWRTVVAPQLGRSPQPFALVQPGHIDAFGLAVPFDAPWQMAFLVRGLHALYAATDDPAVAHAVLQVAEVMAGPCWEEGVGPKMLVAAANPMQYRMPSGYDARAGTGLMQAGAFVLAAECAEDPARAQFFWRRVEFLLQPRLEAAGPAGADSWLQIVWDRRQAQR